jgi:hypothetical protein
MKRYLFAMVLLSMLIGPVAFCKEEGEGMEPEYQMQLQRMKLELAQQESNLHMEERLAELELEKRQLEIEHARRQLARHGGPHHVEPGHLMLIIIAIHILTAVWVGVDIRARRCGGWLWLPIVIMTGLLGTLVYAIVRIGDNTAKKKA